MASGSKAFLCLQVAICHIFLNSIFAAASVAEDARFTIKVLTSQYPPYTYVGDDGSVTGSSTDKVRALLDKTGLPYEIHVVPWGRALRLVSEDPHSLIYSIDRTPDREARFQWLLPLNQVENGLIGRRDLLPQGFSKAMVLAGNYKAVCSDGSSSCELLRQYGFAPENILLIAGRGPEDLVNLLLRGRAAFVAEDPDALFWHARHIDGVANLHVYNQVGEGTTDYLAAGIGADARMADMIIRQAKSLAATE